VSKYTREENIIIFAGLAAHVAPTRGRQDNRFNNQPADVVLAHIKDLSRNVDAQSIGAPAYTAEKQVFHTDVGDVIALFALASAEEGGESFLSSSWTVYNELAATRPDLIRTLAEPWDVDEYASPIQRRNVRTYWHQGSARLGHQGTKHGRCSTINRQSITILSDW
jgi:hypothetical protein